ncbi:TPA: AbrB/MazE/SpoVT family DNA-binding domain-containing protein [bacterium]|nr:AbrB/MazE/SpoVT family DNA-binding domain-containing protein [bacterium]
MSLVKIKEKYQVTIPSAIRDRLSLKVGDVLEADLENDQIVLRPKMIVDKSEAWKRLFEVMDQVHSKNDQFDPKEIEQDVLMAINESRKRKKA